MITKHTYDIDMASSTKGLRNISLRNAFSMAEMLVVLVIIGTISAVAVPRYAQASARQRLDGAVRRVITDLNRVSDRARTTSTSITVWVDLVAHEYRINAIEDPDHPGNFYKVSLLDEPYRVKIIAADFGGLAKLTYNGFGEVVTAGYVDLQIGNLSSRIKIGTSILRIAVPLALPAPDPLPVI